MKSLGMYLGLVTFVSITGGCGQGDDRLKEKAAIESQASAQKQIEAENENRVRLAKEMEDDLQTRHRFYQALKGSYEGSLTTELGEFKLRITLVPSLPPYLTDRVRSLEEITADLNNLYFKTQIVQWNPTNPLSAVGCRFEQVRADIDHGEIDLASESCPNLYMLHLSAGKIHDGGKPLSGAELAQRIKTGQDSVVPEITGQMQPSSNANIYPFSAGRLSR